MKLFKLRIVVFSMLGLFVGLNAQIMSPGKPFETVQQRCFSVVDSSRVLHMPTFDVAKELRNSEALFLDERRYQFGKSFDVDIAPENSGTWQVLNDGTRVWEVEIVSEGALSINVIFSKFQIPDGAEVYIFNKDRTYVIGAFTSLNNKLSGVLPTLPVFGDHVVVQYIEPAGVAFEGDLRVAKVTHDFRGVYNKLRVGNYGDAASCEVDVSCVAKYDDVKRSAVKMIISGSEICSGVLVNNTGQDEKPYILSARHCFKLDTTANSTLIIFNYEVPDCRTDIEGVREQSVAGAEMLAFSPEGALKDLDFALIKASVDIPHTYQPYYAGWNAESAYPKKTFTIHHPLGDVKKVSWDNSSPTATTLEIDYVYFPLSHFRIWSWEGGVTEGGSSGAALFNQNYQVVGALSGGSSTCAQPKNDYFYRLSKAWNPYSESYRQLRYWLDPSGNDIREMAGFYPEGVQKMLRISNVDPEEAIGAVPVSGGEGGYLSGVNNYGAKAVVEKFDDVNGVLKGLYFIPFKGTYSDGTAVNIQVWSGNSQPEQLLHSQPLVINQWSRGEMVTAVNYGQTGGYSVLQDYTDDDYNLLCYVPFSSDIEVDGNCFVGFSWDELADTFVVMQTTERVSTDKNMAWYKTAATWKPFTDYAIGQPSSLSVELLYQTTGNVSVESENMAGHFDVSQIQGDVILSSRFAVVHDFSVEVYDLSGRRYGVVSFEKGQATYRITNEQMSGLVSGVYLLRISGGGLHQVCKVAF